MRESIGATWLFQIVIVFILLFTGYICLSINHSKAFAIKNDIILELQRNGGYNATAASNVKILLERSGYRTSGKCDDGWIGYTRDGKVDNNGGNSVFCLQKVDIAETYSHPNAYGRILKEYPEMFYYKVKVFYQLDLPVLNSFATFSVRGDTKLITPVKS